MSSKRRLNLRVALLLPILALSVVRASAQVGRCASLLQLTAPDVTVTSAEDTPAGVFAGPGLRRANTMLPSFCRVTAVAKPTADSTIRIEVWLPPSSAWNRRLMVVGNGAFIGTVSYDGLAMGLLRGYAVASTDTGHTGEELSFALGHPERLKDWADRSVHITAMVSKLVVRAFEGQLPSFSYFGGCSTGGHQGLTEAQRYPQDFDGILAGDPGNNRTLLTAGFLWDWLAVHDAQGKLILPGGKVTLLHRAALAACDAQDGVRDGVIENPPLCRFDPASLRCRAEESSSCLTEAQLAAVQKIYGGIHNPRTGERLFSGYAVGSESEIAADGSGHAGWRSYMLDPVLPERVGFWSNFVFQDPHFDWRSFDFDRDLRYARSVMSVVDAVNPDLSAFKAHGGKLLLYDGWADPVGPPEDTIAYFQAVQQVAGGPAATARFVQLYMLPGMGHCRGGAGPNAFDGVSVLERWVEDGTAPTSIVAVHMESTTGAPNAASWQLPSPTDTPTRSRLLCPYPATARYGGGDVNRVESFHCESPLVGRNADSH